MARTYIFTTYNKARQILKKKGVRSKNEFYKLPSSFLQKNKIPRAAPSVYKEDWQGWRKFFTIRKDLSEKEKSRLVKPLRITRAFVRRLNLKSRSEFESWRKGYKSFDLPMCPASTYRRQGTWLGWNDYLGTNYGVYGTYKEAQRILKRKKVRSKDEFFKLPASFLRKNKIPRAAEVVYRDEWQGWRKFFTIRKDLSHYEKSKLFLSYEKAKKKIQKFKFINREEFTEWAKTYKGTDIPLAPDLVYKKKGWITWGDFLGNGNQSNRVLSQNYLSFSKAKAFVRKLNLSSKQEYQDWTKGRIRKNSLGEALPKFPKTLLSTVLESTYKGKGWTTWGDFLGTDNLAFFQKEVCAFHLAKRFVRDLNKSKRRITGKLSWKNYCKASERYKHLKTIPSGEFKGLLVKYKNIPVDVEKVYKDKWRDWNLFLFRERHPESIDYLSYREAKRFIHKLKLKSQYDWREYVRETKVLKQKKPNQKFFTKGRFKGKPVKPVRIPSGVHAYYKVLKKEIFFSFGDFLGTGNIANWKKISRKSR